MSDEFARMLQERIDDAKKAVLVKLKQKPGPVIFVLGEGFKDESCYLEDKCGTCPEIKCAEPRARKGVRDMLRALYVIAILPEELKLHNPSCDQKQVFLREEYSFLFMISTRKARSLHYELADYSNAASIAERIVLFIPARYYHFKSGKREKGMDIAAIMNRVSQSLPSFLSDASMKQDVQHGHVYPYASTSHLYEIACKFTLLYLKIR